MAGIATAAAAGRTVDASCHSGSIVDWPWLAHGRDHVWRGGEGAGEGGWFGEGVGHGEGTVAEGVGVVEGWLCWPRSVEEEVHAAGGGGVRGVCVAVGGLHVGGGGGGGGERECEGADQ